MQPDKAGAGAPYMQAKISWHSLRETCMVLSLGPNVQKPLQICNTAAPPKRSLRILIDALLVFKRPSPRVGFLCCRWMKLYTSGLFWCNLKRDGCEKLSKGQMYKDKDEETHFLGSTSSLLSSNCRLAFVHCQRGCCQDGYDRIHL